MALVVETGSATDATANSFVSVADATTYLTDRGVTIPSPVALEQQLHLSMDFLATLEDKLLGNRILDDQPLVYPRWGVYALGREWPTDAVPKPIINAQIEIARAGLLGIAIFRTNDGRFVRRRGLGQLQTEFSETLSKTSPTLDAVSSNLSPFLQIGEVAVSSGSGGSVGVYRS